MINLDCKLVSFWMPTCSFSVSKGIKIYQLLETTQRGYSHEHPFRIIQKHYELFLLANKIL